MKVMSNTQLSSNQIHVYSCVGICLQPNLSAVNSPMYVIEVNFDLFTYILLSSKKRRKTAKLQGGFVTQILFWYAEKLPN